MKFLVLMLIYVSLFGNIGNIMAMKGSAEVKRESKSLNASSGMELFQGDEILTKEKSRVQVMLKDDTVITIGSNSEFSFEEFSQEGENSKVSMRAKRGFFRSVTGKIGKLAPERFKVKTASATIGIRGTDFSGDISVEREIFKCFEGAIFVEFDGSINELDAGMMMEVIGTKYEIQEFDASKVKDSIEKMEGMKGVIIKSMDKSDIPTEVVSDITQIIESIEEGEPPVEEPFEMTLTPEDREIQY